MEPRHRLKRAQDFARVRANDRSWAHPLMILAVAPNGQEISRFGFITSRRLGNAVKRNRAKRLLREVLRQNLSFVSAGWDCVFVARVPLPEASYQQTQAAVIQLFQRARLWNAPQ